MTCIVLASRKGGVGKTTTSIALSFMFARKGYDTAVLELDANKPVADLVEVHSARGHTEHNLTLLPDPPVQEKIKITLKRVQQEHEVVIVDLPGAATDEMLVATAAADLVLIPMRTARWDANEAARTFDEIRKMTDDVRRPPMIRIVLTQTPASPILPRYYRRNVKALEQTGLPRLSTEIANRKEWVSIQEGGAYPDSDTKAWQNAEALFNEVVDLLAVDETEAAE